MFVSEFNIKMQFVFEVYLFEFFKQQIFLLECLLSQNACTCANISVVHFNRRLLTIMAANKIFIINLMYSIKSTENNDTSNVSIKIRPDTKLLNVQKA